MPDLSVSCLSLCPSLWSSVSMSAFVRVLTIVRVRLICGHSSLVTSFALCVSLPLAIPVGRFSMLLSIALLVQSATDLMIVPCCILAIASCCVLDTRVLLRRPPSVVLLSAVQRGGSLCNLMALLMALMAQFGSETEEKYGAGIHSSVSRW